jgi:hypothetical protein
MGDMSPMFTVCDFILYLLAFMTSLNQFLGVQDALQVYCQSASYVHDLYPFGVYVYF